MEYCNIDKGTFYSDLRRLNGSEEPYKVKFWGLGNEMDGEWQMGHKNAEDYGKYALEAAKLMKWINQNLEEVYNLEDALVVAQFLNIFVRQAQVVKMVNMAKLVNIIAPIRTKKDGIFYQAIFYPLALFANNCRVPLWTPLWIAELSAPNSTRTSLFWTFLHPFPLHRC